MSTTVTEITIEGSPHLAAFMVRPSRSNRSGPAVVLCHGFPSKQRPGIPNRTYQQFAERIAEAQGWTVLAVSMRGCGESDGDFSLLGWIDDVGRSIEHVLEDGCRGVWLVGSTTGGSVAILAAARDARVRGVAAMAPRADFDDWAGDPKAFLRHCRNVGVIRSEGFPRSASAWNRELKQNRAVDAVKQLADRPLLILHGINDRQVPYEEARHLASRHPSAELRLITGADHRIRHDPRAVAILLGWLEHQAAAQYA